MGRDNPGSAAEYLRLWREELAAEQEAAREEDDKERFVEQFVAAGGNRADALAEALPTKKPPAQPAGSFLVERTRNPWQVCCVQSTSPAAPFLFA